MSKKYHGADRAKNKHGSMQIGQGRMGGPSVRPVGTRRMELGYYLICTDGTKTEENYFKGLKAALPEEKRNKLEIKVVAGVKTEKLVAECLKQKAKDSQNRELWIVFDKDQVPLPLFDKIIRDAERADIGVGWSNPCIEIWFHAYLDDMPADCDDSKKCNHRFSEAFKRSVRQEYTKNDKNIYAKLTKREGAEEAAIGYAEKRYKQNHDRYREKYSMMIATTTVHRLVQEIRIAAPR